MYRPVLIALIACSALYPSQVAYNAAAKTIERQQSCPTPCGFFFDASFLYWYTAQDGMTIAYSGDDVYSLGLGVYPSPTVVFLEQPFEFSPGFKVGLGYGVKEWEVQAEYTWIRNHTSISKNSSKNPTFGLGNIPVWVSDWFAAGFIPTEQISSSWRLSIDWLDVTAGKTYLQNQAMKLSPYGGVRSLWIRQALLVTEGLPLNGDAIAPGAISHNRTNCWGLGPVAGGKGLCALGAGFTLEADAGVSLLFTQYTKLYRREDNVTINADSPEADVTFMRLLIKDYNCVRPAVNLGLGAGWETSYNKGARHFRLAATYDFNVFWNQNMLHYLQDAYDAVFTANDLFLQGLTLKARFDF